MAVTPDTDLRAFLLTQTLTATTPTIFIGPVRPPSPPQIPYRGLFVLGTGGYMASPYMDGFNSSQGSYRFLRVQVRVRSDVNAFQDGRDLANAVWSVCQTASVSGYSRVTCEQSAPLYLGRDDTEAHEWSVNVIMEKRAV